MRTLMMDLLDLAQLEQHEFKLNEDFFNLYDVIASAFQLVRHLADKKKVRLIIKTAEHD